MTVTFAPQFNELRQLVRACRTASIPYEVGLAPSPSITCQFDDVAEFIEWHAIFVGQFGWSPYDCEVSLSD